MAVPSDDGRGVLPTQGFRSVMPMRVPSNSTNRPLLVPRNANICAGFQLVVPVVAFAVSSYTTEPVAPPALTTSLNEVGVQNDCHRYTADGATRKMLAKRLATSSAWVSPRSRALKVMQWP